MNIYIPLIVLLILVASSTYVVFGGMPRWQHQGSARLSRRAGPQQQQQRPIARSIGASIGTCGHDDEFTISFGRDFLGRYVRGAAAAASDAADCCRKCAGTANCDRFTFIRGQGCWLSGGGSKAVPRATLPATNVMLDYVFGDRIPGRASGPPPERRAEFNVHGNGATARPAITTATTTRVVPPEAIPRAIAGVIAPPVPETALPPPPKPAAPPAPQAPAVDIQRAHEKKPSPAVVPARRGNPGAPLLPTPWGDRLAASIAFRQQMKKTPPEATAPTTCSQAFTTGTGLDVLGADLNLPERKLRMPLRGLTPEKCCLRCAQVHRCNAYTHAKGECWLKHVHPKAAWVKRYHGSVAGLRRMAGISVKDLPVFTKKNFAQFPKFNWNSVAVKAADDGSPLCSGHGFQGTKGVSTSLCVCDPGWIGDDCAAPAPPRPLFLTAAQLRADRGVLPLGDSWLAGVLPLPVAASGGDDDWQDVPSLLVDPLTSPNVNIYAKQLQQNAIRGGGAQQGQGAIAKLTCAVVGSASTMQGKRQGAAVDAHDVVFRFNNAPTRGFEQDVGRKTTFDLWNVYELMETSRSRLRWPRADEFRQKIAAAKSSGNHDAPVPIFHARSEDWVRQYETFRKRMPQIPVLMLDQTFSRHCYSWFAAVNPKPCETNGVFPMFQGCDFPTTGFFGVCFALHHCTNVTLFGFHDRGRTVRRNHYWKAGQDIAGGHHNFNLEHSLYRSSALKAGTKVRYA